MGEFAEPHSPATSGYGIENRPATPRFRRGTGKRQDLLPRSARYTTVAPSNSRLGRKKVGKSPNLRQRHLTMPILIAIAVVEQNDHFLIGERPTGVALAGMWEFPGGKIEPGESPAEAAVRECWEETGLEVIAGEAYPRQEQVYTHGTVELHFIACFLPANQPEPRAPFRWVKRTDLAKYDFPAGNRPLLALLSAGG